MVRMYLYTIFFLIFTSLNSLFAQTTAIPDPYFEQALIDLDIDSDGIINGSVATADIEDVTTLDISNRYIELLAGIEDFTNLTELYCQNNILRHIYLTKNTKLKVLNCSSQLISYLSTMSIDISENKELEYLNCSNNPPLYGSLNPGLNPNLKTLICSNIGLTSLNVSNNSQLEYLNCSNNYYDDGYEVRTFTHLELGQNTNLKTIGCNNNEISILNLTGLPNLTNLNCSSNDLTGLDIMQNTNLITLICNDNKIKSLNFQDFPNLNTLGCSSNQLTILNIKNGNNTNLTTFDARNNPSLTCIEVDDADAVNSGLPPYDSWLKDDTAIYLNDCENATFIPDPNFELALIYAGIDSDETVNGVVATSDVINVTELDISYFPFEINNIIGIEDFESLKFLRCIFNEMTTLNLSQNSELETLICFNSHISSIYIGQNENLSHIDCEANGLTDLDISGATALEYLNFGSNKLSNINLERNINLTTLDCYSNLLSTLEVNNCPSLINLWCGGNQLTTLDIGQNQNLRLLACDDNQLTSLNVKNGNNTGLFVYAINNPSLFCVQVDDEVAANAGEPPYESWEKDDFAIYSEDCSSLGIEEEILDASISIYPNPVLENLSIEATVPITKIEVYSLLGKKIKEFHTPYTHIPMQNLSNGIYFVKILSDKSYITKKIIKL